MGGRLPTAADALKLATEYGWPSAPPTADRRAQLWWDGLAECPLCETEDCEPEPEPEIGDWWSTGEAEDAHYVWRTSWRYGGPQYIHGLCGLAFEPVMAAPGILFDCVQLQHHGACILCRDVILGEHKRSSCTVRGCRITELLEEFDRGVFR